MRTLCLLALSVTSAFAADTTVRYQGRVMDALGEPLNSDEVDLTLRVYIAGPPEVVAHTELFEDVQVRDGYFAVLLGHSGGLTRSELRDATHIGIELNQEGELTPRQVVGGTSGFSAGHNADGSSASSPAPSCRSILESGVSEGSGYYFLDPDGAGDISPYSAYCDMDTLGGGWTLVNRKATPGFIPIEAATVFSPTCAGSRTGNCGSIVPPGMYFRELMWRFEDTDAYAVMFPEVEPWMRAVARGADYNSSSNVFGAVRWLNGATATSNTISFAVSTADGWSESHGGSDQWLDAWHTPDSTNNYTSVSGSGTAGTMCVAGHCRLQTIWFMVR